MRVTVLGSGTSVPSVRRGSPCFLLQVEGATALVDSGAGALRQLARAGLGPSDLTDLLYTHAHLDHTSDLWPLLFVAGNPIAVPRPRRLRIHGSAAFFTFFERVSAACGEWVAPAGVVIERLVHDGVPLQLGDATVRAHPVPHIPSSVAYRAEHGGRVVVFSGDTDRGEEIVNAARGADLLVLECATPDGEKVAGHLTPSLCAEIAREAAVARLLLTHFYPSVDPVDAAAVVRRGYSGEVTVAEDFLVLDV